jgi:phenylacetate-CoA ligase
MIAPMPKPEKSRLDRMVFKLRDVLAETERLPPDKLQAYQENLLAPLVLHAHRNVPFYEDRLASLCFGTEVELERWHTIPILTREDVRRNSKALAAVMVPPYMGPTKRGETSGSSGRPIRYLVNELANVASLGATDRTFRWWDFDGNKSMAAFVARHDDDARPPDGRIEKGWRVGFSGFHHMLDLSADPNAQLEWLRKRRPNYLTAHSFVLNEVARLACQQRLDLRLERIISIGTVLTDDIRNACEEAFGVQPIDQYGAQETGLLACECPWCGNFHINAETALIEILDPNGRPSAPETAGRVVVTSLYNYAMPFIRYELGDFAIAGSSKVKCPIKLPTVVKILGRYRNAFYLHDGRTIYPYVPVSRLEEYLSFEQIQIVQTDPTSIEVRYVPLSRNEGIDQLGLQACLRELIDPSFSVQAVAVDEIPRSPSGKFEDYFSLVTRPQN